MLDLCYVSWEAAECFVMYIFQAKPEDADVAKGTSVPGKVRCYVGGNCCLGITTRPECGHFIHERFGKPVVEWPGT